MIEIFKIRFPAFTGEEDRRVYVYLPSEYYRDSEAHFPVLYMFDGHNVFYNRDATYGKSWGLGRYLRRNHVPLIVVAVECHHGSHGERLNEYCPFDFSAPAAWVGRGEGNEKVHMKGYGDDTLKWFTEVLKPEIDSNYRTCPERERTFLMGSSMGGLMSLYGLIRYNDVFSRACALSPSTEFWFSELKQFIRETPVSPDTGLFIDYGTSEWDFKSAMKKLNVLSGILFKHGVDMTIRTVPGGTHSETCWEKELPFCIEFLMFE